ncbi:MAG: 3-dehydroquinate synthase [Kiritimatiellae bacterium]|jgi:3-dehydroquinate synthase|nr:3-dehydroquinate synthase [Kiritimatiellia bacterium]
MSTSFTHTQTFSVPFTYPVHFAEDVFAPDSERLLQVIGEKELPGSPRKLMVVIDEGVSTAFPDLADRITHWFNSRSDYFQLIRPPEIVPGGEALKNDYRLLMSLVDQMLAFHLCRHSFVLVIGGGAVLDAVGFATSLVHRGLRLIRMPSTTLAQNDAGIGVKNGMNLHGGKNTVGVFAPPFAVLNDFTLLEGLTDHTWRDGISEAFKVAMIKDAAFFNELLEMAPALGRRNATAMHRLIVRCAELHLEHIATSGDPFELGSARPLDFGHWSAHKLESISNYRISHGQAVAMGIVLDSAYAARLGWIETDQVSALKQALLTCGFDLAPPELTQRLGDGSLHVLQGLEEFREHLGGRLTLSLPGPIGSIREIHEFNPVWLSEEIQALQMTPCD